MREVRTPGDPKPVDANPGDEAPAPKAKRERAAPAPAALAPGELPNAIDIDAKAITSPVLTKQGWVCPDESGQRKPDSHKP